MYKMRLVCIYFH